jgi:hypothetical protein
LSRQDKYHYAYISAGYRCQAHNHAMKRSSINHMGMAVDIHFSYRNSKSKTIAINKNTIEDLRKIRDDFYQKYLKSQEGWSIPAKHNRFRTEPIGIGKEQSYSWIHMDVFLCDPKYKLAQFFVKEQCDIKGTSLIEVGKECKLLDMCNCNI